MTLRGLGARLRTDLAEDTPEARKRNLKAIGKLYGGAGLGTAATLASPLAALALPRHEFEEVVLTPAQTQRLKEMSPSTRVRDLADLQATGPGGKPVSKKGISKYPKNQSTYYPREDQIIAHVHNGWTPRGQILAHELGHGRIHNTPVLGKAIRAGRAAALPLMMLSTGAALAAPTNEENPYSRLGNAAQWGGVAAVAPTLVDEGASSLLALRKMRELGVPKPMLARSRRDLARAFGSYLAAGTAMAATPFAIRALKRRSDRKRRS